MAIVMEIAVPSREQVLEFAEEVNPNAETTNAKKEGVVASHEWFAGRGMTIVLRIMVRSDM